MASRTSAFQYKDKAVDVRVIGQQLNVRTCSKAACARRATASGSRSQLTDIEGGGYSLWGPRGTTARWRTSSRCRRRSRRASRRRSGRPFSIPIKGAAARSRTGNVESYHAYLRGRYFWNKRTEEDLRKGIRCFEEAIASDPGFAAAYAGLADSYVLLGIYGAAPPADVMPCGREAAVRALKPRPDARRSAHLAGLHQRAL